MAVRDVKEYYYKLLVQSAEMKADLEDFEKALKAGDLVMLLANVVDNAFACAIFSSNSFCFLLNLHFAGI